jgi:hypothetical protein
LKLLQAPLDRFAMTAQKLSDVGDTAVPQLEGFRRDEETTLSFIEGGKGEPYGLFNRLGVSGEHGGILPNGRTKHFLSKLPRLPPMPRAKKAKWDSYFIPYA